MFGKLLKLEFKETAKTMLMMYVCLIILGLLGYVFSHTNINAGTALFVLLFFFMTLVLNPITGIIMAKRYNKSMFSKEGYLTHTLPVTQVQLYSSKLLVALCWSLTSLLISAISMASIFKISDFWDEVILEVADYFSLEPSIILIILAIILVVGFLLAFLIGVFFACTICNTKRFQGLGSGGPLLIYFILYILLQIASVIGARLLPLTIIVNNKLQIDSIVFKAPIKLGEIASRGNTNTDIGIGATIFMYFVYAFITVYTIKLLKKRICVK